MDAICDSNECNEMINSSESPCVDKPKVKKVKKKRCPVCNKKLGLMPFTCKCGLDFCVSHVQPELHNCSFDHKSEEKGLLNSKLIKVVHDKIQRI